MLQRKSSFLILVIALLTFGQAWKCSDQAQPIDLVSAPGTIYEADGMYPANMNCQWRVHPSGMVAYETVVIAFSTFNLALGDHLYIWDNVDPVGPATYDLTGSAIPDPIQTTGQAFFMEFVSDGTWQALGFEATYSIVPPPPPCDEGWYSYPECEVQVPDFLVADYYGSTIYRFSAGALTPVVNPYAPIGLSIKMAGPEKVLYTTGSGNQIVMCDFPSFGGCSILFSADPSGILTFLEYDEINGLVIAIEQLLNQIFIIDPTGANPTQIFTIPVERIVGMAVDTENRLIYFTSLNEDYTNAVVWVIAYDGTGLTQLTQNLGNHVIYGLVLDRTLGVLIFVSSTTGQFYMMNTDGTGLHTWGSMLAPYVSYMILLEQTSGTWLLWSTMEGKIYAMPLLPDAVPWLVAGGLSWPFQIAPLLWGNCGEEDLCSGHGQCTGDGCHCEPGWMGTDCSVGMQPLECPNGCSGHGTCDQWTGYCTCEPGYEQPDCHPAFTPVVCPAQYFFPATYTTAEVVGDELQLLTHGYNISKYVIARGPPPAQTNPHCILPPVLNQPDPSDLCIIDMSTSVLISELALCPDVVVSTVNNGGTTLEYSIPMHVLSMVRTGIDPEGVPVIGWRYQSMEIILVQTIALNLTTSVHVMHLVNFTGFEKGDSFFDHSNADFTFHFTTWTNQHYTQTGVPILDVLPPSVDPTMVSVVADPAADDCADPVRFCARGWVMTISNLQSPCQVAGRFIFREHVECSDAGLCPRDAAGDYFGYFDINPGTCDVALVNITVTGQLWVDMTGQGTAIAWGRRASVLGQLTAQSILSAANMAYLRVCTLPHAGAACPDGSYQILITDNTMGPLAVQLDGIFTHDTMNYNLSMVFDLLAFHYALAVDTNPNLITDLQFDAHWNNFVPGHISEAAYQAKLRSKVRGPKARTVTWWNRSPMASNGGDEDQGPLVTENPVDYSVILTMTGGAVDPLPSPPTPVTPGGMPASTVAAISVGSVVGVFAIVGAVATALVITRRLRNHTQAKTVKQTPVPQPPQTTDEHKES